MIEPLPYAGGSPQVLKLRIEHLKVSDTSRVDIVCYLHILETGLEIRYSHHEFFERPMPGSPWKIEHVYSLPLTESLEAVIRAGAMHEFWAIFCSPAIRTERRQ